MTFKATRPRTQVDSWQHDDPQSEGLTHLAEPEEQAIEDLVRHAEKFGCDSVYETAAERKWRQADLARLKASLRNIAEQHRKARRPRSWWETVPQLSGDDIAALRREGLAVDEIARLTGKSRNAIQRGLQRDAARAQNAESAMEKSSVI